MAQCRVTTNKCVHTYIKYIFTTEIRYMKPATPDKWAVCVFFFFCVQNPAAIIQKGLDVISRDAELGRLSVCTLSHCVRIYLSYATYTFYCMHNKAATMISSLPPPRTWWGVLGCVRENCQRTRPDANLVGLQNQDHHARYDCCSQQCAWCEAQAPTVAQVFTGGMQSYLPCVTREWHQFQIEFHSVRWYMYVYGDTCLVYLWHVPRHDCRSHCCEHCSTFQM